MNRYQIAVLPGDGIGPEVIAEGVKGLLAAQAAVGGFELALETLPAGAGEYLANGKPLPDATVERCRAADAILLGAMGLPNVRWPGGTEMVPQVELRFRLDLYAGLRPIRRGPRRCRSRATAPAAPSHSRRRSRPRGRRRGGALRTV